MHEGESRKLTTDAGALVADNQNIITAGKRGPALLQDVWYLSQDVRKPGGPMSKATAPFVAVEYPRLAGMAGFFTRMEYRADYSTHG